MFKKILPLLLVASLFLTASSSVQALNTTALQISNMEIDIWPDYDQPSTLVIYHISFASLTNFPAKVSFTIPASAGDPYSVAMKDLDGLLYDLEYSVVSDGNWNRIEFISSTPDIQLEFYDPIKQAADGSYNYSLRWISDYPIADLKMVVQKPKYATTMTIQPDFGPGVVSQDDGLTYFTTDVGSLNQGDSINVSLSYLKANDLLSASILPVHAINPLPQNTSLWQTIIGLFKPVWENRSLLISSGLLFAGILLLFLGFWLSLRKKSLRMETVAEVATDNPPTKKINTSETLEVYCHVCGKRARPGDLYCRTCGSKLIQR